MSGHSKWSTIKRQKGANDFKKGQLFTRLSKQIVHAAKSGGDPELNFSLRMAVQKAKEGNMSSENIMKAVRKGTGEDKSADSFEEMEYEAMVGNRIGLLIDTLTENKNRTVSEIRMILERNGATMVSSGAVSWQFSSRGVICLPFQRQISSDQKKWNEQNATSPVQDLDDFIAKALEIDGIEDIQQEEDTVYVYTAFDKLDSVRKALEEEGYTIQSFEIMKIATNSIEPSTDEEDTIQKVVDALEENEDVSSVWLNI